MKKVLVPKVRFKGFGEEWKEDTIGNIANITNGKLDANAMVKSGMYNFYTSGIDVYKIDKYSFEGEGISIAGNGVNMGYMHLVSGKYNAYQRTYILNNIKIDRHFLFYNLWKNFWEFCQKNTREGSIPYLLYNDISDFKIFKSHSNEQQKIGKLLDQISNLINLENSKLNKLKQLKETLLQKMFPEGNSKTPKIRFKGFSEEWKEERLEETVNILDNLRIPVKESLRSPGAYKYYGANGIQGKINGYTHQGENILIAEDGANDLNNYPLIFEKNKIWVNNHAHVVTSNNPNLLKNYFLYLSLKKVNFSDYILGTQRYKLTLSNLKEVLFVITKNIDEQQKIGDFFSKIDSLINLYNSKLNKLKQLKAALLQKMFV